MKRIVMFTLDVGLLTCALTLASVSFSQQNPSQGGLPGSPADRQQREQEQQQQPQVKSFSGKISKAGDKFILEEETLRTSFQLDDLKKVQPYQGKRVVITGILDAQHNVIHVQAIEEAL